MVFEPGQQVGGLQIEKELGRGAYGVVYLARDALLGRRVALKVLPGGDEETPEDIRAQVLTEARLIGNLNSPHIVTLYRLHAAGDGGWMQEMEFVEGGGLEDELKDGKALPLDRAVAVFRGVCLALKTAHANRVIHGDIKTGNVLFGADGIVKLADFGLARMIEGGGKSVELHGEIFGTPHYMAPEVIIGQQAGMASDLWATGVLFYQCLTGKLPFPAMTYGELAQGILHGEPEPLPGDIPAPLRKLVARCLAKEAAERPESAAAIVAEIDAAAKTDESLGRVEVRTERPTNLGPEATTFVGREKEIGEIGELLADEATRLLTILGPGGIGKTRISQKLCAVQLEHFPGGCWFVDLSEVYDADGIANAVALALGTPLSGKEEPARLVADILQYREPMLMVLDNFEQILEHATATIALWLKRAPKIRFLVTSRALLGIAGEKEYELFPLPTPSWELDPTDLETVAGFAGVQLFVTRAQEAKPAFALDEGNAPAVVQIVKELDGMPLAIELAAARARIMKPDQIAKKLGQKFSLLQSTRRDLQARQKTLTGAIEWSFDLLEPWEKEAYLQACYFRDGFTLESAEMVLDLTEFDDAPLAMDVAQSLREKSLLTARDTGYETRLGMYRAIREFGQRKWEKEAEADKRTELAQRHAEFFLGFAEEWNQLIPGPRDQEAMDRIADEIGNFGAVQAWALENGDAEIATNATLAIAETMKVRRPPRQLLPLVERALEALGDERNDERVRLLTYLSIACYLSGDWDRAQATADEAVALGYELGSDRPLCQALRQQGEVRRNRGDLTGAMEAFLNSELIAIGNGDRAALAVAIGDRGMVLGQEGDRKGALECFSEAEAIAREVGAHQTVALHVSNRGVMAEWSGDAATAIACQREAEDMARRMGDRLWAAVCLGKRANVLVQSGEHDAGLKCYREAETIARELGAKQRIAQIVGNRGSVHAMRDELDAALKCYEEAEAIARELGEQRQMALMLGQRASILVRAGQREEAEKCYGQAEEICGEIGDRRLEARYRCSRGGLMHELGRLDEAWEALRSGIAIFDEIGEQSTIYFALKAQLAAVAHARGEEAEANRIAAEGLALAEALSLTDEHPNPAIRKGLATLREIEGRETFFEE